MDPSQDDLPQPMGTNRQPRGGAPPRTSGAVVQRSLSQTPAERQARIEQLRTREDSYEQYDEDKPKKKHRLLRFLGWMLLIVVLTAGLGAAGWFFWLRNQVGSSDDNSATQQTQPATPATPPAQEEAAPTQTFTSSQFQLQFDYPQDWKATEGSDNKISVVSTPTKLKTVAGQQVTGQIVMTIQHKQTSLPDFAKGPAQAARESQKMSYTKPSQTQRAQTYLSFLSYAASAGKGLDAVYVTGDNGYQADQEVPLADVTKADPLISVSFRGCQDAKCATPDKALSLPASLWDDQTFSKPILTMLQSIVVQ